MLVIVSPRQTMVDNVREFADEVFGTTIAVGEVAAEFVDGQFGIGTDCRGILADIGARARSGSATG